MVAPPDEFLQKITFDGTRVECKLPTFNDIGKYAFVAHMLFGLVNEHFKIGFDGRRLKTQRLGQVVIEAITNAAEHGNQLVSKRSVTLSVWLGSKGAVFCVQDEGVFFTLPSTKEMVESRISILSTRCEPGGGGSGMECIYEAADGICVDIDQNALFLLVLADSVVATDGSGWAFTRNS